MPKRARRLVAIATSAVMLAGCVTTRESRIGPDDGTDACRAQLVALDSTGDFFGEDILRGAALGAVGGALLGATVAAATGRRGGDILAGAAIGGAVGGVAGAAGGYFQARQRQASDQATLVRSIAGDLAAENAQLDLTWVAYTQLMDCRFGTAQRVRTDLRAGRINRAQAEGMMANERARAQRDLALARSINERITSRGEQFDVAIENVAPGTKQAALAGATVSRPVPVQARASVPLKLRPDPAAPDVAQVSPRERVTVQGQTAGFALVETSSGVRGYAPVNAFPEAQRLPSRPSVVGTGTSADSDVRSLAASNIARRDNFTQSITNAERLAQGQGFELAAG